MALTLTQMRSAIRDDIDISSTNILSDARLNNYINMERDKIVADLHGRNYKYLENSLYVDLSTSTNFDDIARGGIKIGLPTDYERAVRAQYESTTNSKPKLIKMVTPTEYAAVESSGRAIGKHGSKYVFTIKGDSVTQKRYMYVYPDPEGVGYIRFDYRWNPVAMTADGDTSDLPARFDNLIILGAARLCLLKANDVERYNMLSDVYRQEYGIVMRSAPLE